MENRVTIDWAAHEADSDKYNYPERNIKSIVYKHDDLIIKFVKTLEQG